MESKELKIGDILQINPEKNDKFAGFFVVVTEPKNWGAQGYLLHHDFFEACRIKDTGKAYVRVRFEDVELVGSCFWIHEN